MENDTDDYVYQPDDDYYLSDDDQYRPESEDIVASVLLLLGIFPILPVLGWIILSFYRKRWDRKHVSPFLVSLLITDTLQLIASPFVVETVLTGVPCWHASWWCTTVYILFSVSKFCGLLFHLLVALDKIYPNFLFTFIALFFVYLLACPVYIGFTIIVNVVYINDLHFYGWNTFFGVVALILAAAACVRALKPLPTSNPTKDKCQVLAVAMFTFMILYVPEFLYWIIQHHKPAWTGGFSYVVHYLPCLRPITDCVLCWFVCVDGERPREQQPTDVELIPPILDSSHSVTSPSQNTLEEKDHGEGPPIREDARNQGKIH
ncbi:uncharacterized protein [Salmo salar]|uniref:Uncharacterized protein LOC106577944 n=1 Tax=Salmo salar TaxID=8030 RepID=A0ABM3DF56_SALSA|nr:uncharacterized protein LOC106577944 [Salmo salar]XP_045557446.1 uncharacterized protein LOC106577944 [Salmo salar]XP_045557447.1 uncharacterized protein LOC106577944 [Salmo salar]